MALLNMTMMNIFTGFGMAIFDRCDENAIAVVVIHNEDIAGALTGSGGEPTGEVHVGLSSWHHDGCVTIVHSLFIVGGGWKIVIVRQHIWQHTLRAGLWLWARGMEVLALLVKVAFDGCG